MMITDGVLVLERTRHGRDMWRDAAFAFHLSQLERRPELEERISSKQSSEEDTVWLQGFLYLHEDARQVVDPVQTQTRDDSFLRVGSNSLQ